MPQVPVYDVGGRQRTQAMRAVQPSDEAFGAGIGRAASQFGGNISQVGDALKEEERKNDATVVTDAYTQGTKRLREAQFNPTEGLYTRTGKNAQGVMAATEQTSETIYNEISDTLKSPQQKELFKQMWQRKSESAVDGAAEYEFKQAKALREETKTSGLANLQNDAVANYKNEKALAVNFDDARAIIRANSDGLSPEGVKRLEREGISSLHVAIIQRLVQDTPGEGLDYYEKHKSEIEGKDHAVVDGWIKGVDNIRKAKTAVDEISNSGPAISIYSAVEKAESNGIADAEGFRANEDGQRAQGLMQLMPDTAREQAHAMGMSVVAGMNDKELGEFFATPEGQKVNRKLGSAYLNKQLVANGGDLEAALIAYNAGPSNATKFLNGGRDYSVLPKATETYSYVKKVMGAYLGVDLSGAKEEDGSRGIQDVVTPKVPGSRYNGDSQAFLLTKLAKGKDQEHITAMQPLMRDSLAAMMNAAPDEVKQGLGILSGTRTVARQQQLWDAAVKKYGSAEKARKWVAPPGNSQHNHGNAADLSWNGDYFSKAPANVQKWVHTNASKFGLKFPLPNEAWHIETEGARDPSKKTSRFATVDVDPARMAADDDTSGQVVSDGVGPSPASVYTSVMGPYTVTQQKSDISDLLSEAEDRYKDDPAMLAEVQRQIKQDYEGAQLRQKEATEQKQRELYARVLGGESVADMDRNELLAVGEDNVGKLMKIEEKFAKQNNPDETDEATYVELSRMSPEELRAADIMSYADKLSRADLKTWADRQAAATRPGTKDQVSAGMRSRTEIVKGAVNMLGLDPKPGTPDAKSVAMLDRALDERIAAYAAEKGAAPDAIEIQKMVDGLVMSGNVQKDWAIDETKRVFELTPEEKGSFYPGEESQYAGSFGDIPMERQQAVANTFARIYPSLADKGVQEEGYVTLYNDMLRIEQGAAPSPPDDLAPQIRQAYAKKYGIAPDAGQIADVYRRMILKSVGR